MALITCRECDKQISSEAKVCPGCGAKVVIAKPAKKKGSINSFRNWMIALAILSALVLLGERANPKSPEELKQAAAVKQKAQEKFDRESQAAKIANAVQHASRNPDRVSWESIQVNDDASVVCIIARMENGFGGLSLEHITSVNGSATTTTKDWNKYCGAKLLVDVTQEAIYLIQYVDNHRLQ